MSLIILGSHTLKNLSIILHALYSKYELKQQCLGFYCSTKLHVHVDEYIVGKNANEQSMFSLAMNVLGKKKSHP